MSSLVTLTNQKDIENKLIADAANSKDKVDKLMAMTSQELINQTMSKDRQVAILKNLLEETEVKIIRLSHQNTAFEEIVLKNLFGSLGKAEIEGIQEQIKQNKIAIITSLDNLKLIQDKIDVLSSKE